MDKRYKAIIAYDGSSFIGWQRQIEGLSVQSAIEEVLSAMHKRPVKVTASGRTDKGVNALAQVIHFDSDLKLDIKTYLRALNAQVNEAIIFKHLEIVDHQFHARKDAKYKIYQYRIGIGEVDIFKRHQVFYTQKKLDVERLKEAAQVFVGTHDFSSFNTNSKEEMPNQVRTIYKVDVTQEEDEIRITFVGSGFMRYMVRMMTQTLMEVANHKLTIDDLARILEAKDKTLVSYLAKPQGLTLLEVGYVDYQNN